NQSVADGGGDWSGAPQACPLRPLPVIYYRTLLCLGLPGTNLHFLYVSVCVFLCVYGCACMYVGNVADNVFRHYCCYGDMSALVRGFSPSSISSGEFVQRHQLSSPCAH